MRISDWSSYVCSTDLSWSWARRVIDRDSDLHPPFCRRGLLVGANGGAVDHLDGAVVGGSDGVHQVVPYACLPPSGEAVVTGGTWAIALRQVAPRRTGTQHPEDAVQHAPIIDARHPSRLVGQQRLDHAPLEVGQVVSAHADAESDAGLAGTGHRCRARDRKSVG